MRKLIFGLCTLIQVLVPVAAHSAARLYALEPAHTTVSFEVKSFGIAKQRGVFDEAAGTGSLDPNGKDGLVDILVNARSVHTGEAAVQTFLRGSSFLNVEQFAEIAYRANRVVFLNGKPAQIDGRLTLLGVSREVTLTVSDYSCQEGLGSCLLNATATFRRSEFGMSRYIGLVSDEVKLEIHSVTKELPAADTRTLTASAVTSRDP